MVQFDEIKNIDFGTPFQIDKDGRATILKDENVNLDEVTVIHLDDSSLKFSGLPDGWEPVYGINSNGRTGDPLLESCEVVGEITLSGVYEEDSTNVFALVTLMDADHGSKNAWDTCSFDTHEDCDFMADCYMVVRKVA